MSSEQTSLAFRENTVRALKDPALRAAMKQAADTFGTKRADAFAPVADLEGLRDRASAIREDVLANLPTYVDRFVVAATRAGAVVHRADDAATAREIIRKILADRGARLVVKGKSMVSEEVDLNSHLEAAGMEVVETDLGEYIIQMEGETPSHIIVPAIHKNRRQVGRLFADRLGVPYSDDPQVLTKIARKVLREKFLSADAGISGANFAAADSGSLVLFTNEGNGRMVTTVPPLHVAILSIEKMLPSLADLPTFIRLLAALRHGPDDHQLRLDHHRHPESGGCDRRQGAAHRPAGQRPLRDTRRRVPRDAQVHPLRRLHERLPGLPDRGRACLRLDLPRTDGDRPDDAADRDGEVASPGGRQHALRRMRRSVPGARPARRPDPQLRRRKVREGFSDPTVRRGWRCSARRPASPTLFALGQRLAGGFWPAVRALGGKDVAGRMPAPAKTPLRRRLS